MQVYSWRWQRKDGWRCWWNSGFDELLLQLAYEVGRRCKQILGGLSHAPLCSCCSSSALFPVSETLGVSKPGVWGKASQQVSSTLVGAVAGGKAVHELTSRPQRLNQPSHVRGAVSVVSRAAVEGKAKVLAALERGTLQMLHEVAALVVHGRTR